MSYRNVDYTKKKKSKPVAKKSNLVKSDETGTFKWERTGTRQGKKKKYLTNFSDIKARAKEKMTSNKAYSASTFKEAFDQATKGDKLKFRWKNKDYLTTKGKREDRFPVTTDKKKPADKKLNIFQKFTKKMRGTNPDGSIRTQAEFEAARDKRKLEKRITKIKERKNQRKSYSAKNLKELEAKLNQ